MHFDLMVKMSHNINGKKLFIIDENIKNKDMELLSTEEIVVLTNRFDIYEQLKTKKLNVYFKDFDLSIFPDNNFTQIFFRVSKEKAATHFIINNAERLLCKGGQLILCGEKNDGIKSYAETAAKSFNSPKNINKNRSIYLASIRRSDQKNKCTPKIEADDNNYLSLRNCIPYLDHKLISKPGIFGWEKIDNGSKFLGDFIPDFLSLFNRKLKNILDLGCGYGYLSIRANSYTKAKITATDNNAAAISACTENFLKLNINGEVIADDCAHNMNKLFDAIICNPPFHRGFETDKQLSKKFVNSSYDRLRKGGMALFVVNCFVPIEKYTNKFLQTKIIANNKSYRLILLIK